MTYNSDVKTNGSCLKIRAGFFINNVYSKPLVSVTEIKEKAGLDPSTLGDDVQT